MSEKIVPIRNFLYVWVALVILTGAQAGIAHVNLGAGTVPVQLIIALGMAAVVIAFWMHLRESDHVVYLAVLAGIVWLTILLTLTLSDYITRPWTAQPR